MVILNLVQDLGLTVVSHGNDCMQCGNTLRMTASNSPC